MVPRLQTLLHIDLICTTAFGGGTILPLILLAGKLSTEKLSSLPKGTQLVCRELAQLVTLHKYCWLSVLSFRLFQEG